MVNLTTIADKYVGTPYAMPVGTDLTEDIRHWILAVNIIGLVSRALTDETLYFGAETPSLTPESF